MKPVKDTTIERAALEGARGQLSDYANSEIFAVRKLLGEIHHGGGANFLRYIETARLHLNNAERIWKARDAVKVTA